MPYLSELIWRGIIHGIGWGIIHFTVKSRHSYLFRLIIKLNVQKLIILLVLIRSQLRN